MQVKWETFLSDLKFFKQCDTVVAMAFDLTAFRLSMITPVKKSFNHSRTIARMRETGWEQQQKEVRLRSDSTV